MADEPQPQGAAEPQAAAAPDEEELRARLEEELRKLRVEDVLLQSVVSLINLTSRRIAKPDEQDLAQAKTGIEAIRALAELLEDEPAAQVREALSQLQVAYASEAGGGGAPAGDEPGPQAGEPAAKPSDPAAEPPKPAAQPGQKPPPKLWTPHERG